MNEGFFSSSQVQTAKKFPPLPPQLNVKFPYEEPFKKKEAVYSSKIKQMIMDIECYPNYFLVKFLNPVDDKVFEFEMTQYFPLDCEGIKAIIRKYEIVTFNGVKFDMPILRLALTGASNLELKDACDDLIQTEIRTWQFEKKHDLPTFKVKHIDLIELCIGIVSLKIYAGRLNCKVMQDLPYHPSLVLTEDQMDEVCNYCGNDLINTKLILVELQEQIELRRVLSKRYSLDLMSKSDAQIAEAIFVSELEEIRDCEIEKRHVKAGTFYYKIPDFINFKTPVLQKVLDILTDNQFEIAPTGRPVLIKQLADYKVKINGTTYRMGMGGLHSTEKSTYHVADDDYTYHDWDVTSYYPEIIRSLGLYPKQMGKEFVPLYGSNIDERVAAKVAGNKAKANSFKIILNGSFGKFGSPYSYLYAPEMLVQVTMTGQLALLMLIEEMELKGIPCVSGNTDGIVLKCHTSKFVTMGHIIKRWEAMTGFSMEETQYEGLFNRDVNNYIAIQPDGKVKLKGCFAPAGLSKNTEYEICTIAMVNYIKHGIDFAETICGCRDIRKFVTIRSVAGGAEKDGKLLGKAIRWFYSKDASGAILCVRDGSKVAATDGAKPLMVLPDEFPSDVNYQWYIDKTKELFSTKKKKDEV